MQIKRVNGVDPTVVSGREKRARLWRCKGLYDSVKNTQRNTVLQAILFVNDEIFFRTWCSKYLYLLYATVHSVSEIFPLVADNYEDKGAGHRHVNVAGGHFAYVS